VLVFVYPVFLQNCNVLTPILFFFSRLILINNYIKQWANYYKTGCYKDLAPYDPDWLYVRAASVAYQLYMRQKVGVNTLRKHYGGKQRNGTCTEYHRLVAGKCIRYCLIELEKAQLVGKMHYESKDGNSVPNGKALTKKGTTDMDRIAREIANRHRKAE
jgi:small subunit ribosomal protein S19e